MKIAILDPASGIAGDIFLGALVDVGLDRGGSATAIRLGWRESRFVSRRTTAHPLHEGDFGYTPAVRAAVSEIHASSMPSKFPKESRAQRTRRSKRSPL